MRCKWCETSDKMIRYHDEEWGIPVHDDKKQFEFLMLEAMQCGLSWNLMIEKREIFRECFADFDPQKVAQFTSSDETRILNTPGMLRSPAKIRAVINNAQCFMKLKEEFGSFDAWLWHFTDGKTLVYPTHADGSFPAADALSEKISRELSARGFKYLGAVTLYSHLQACGMINDHSRTCDMYSYINTHYPVMHISPIMQFVENYIESGTVRGHMPGHKGRGLKDFYRYDITEITGADALYEADGIIRESEKNTSFIFGSGETVFGAEGSSQCVKTMLYLAAQIAREEQAEGSAALSGPQTGCDARTDAAQGSGAWTQNAAARPLILAARNAHKSFLMGCALCDLEVVWVYPDHQVSSVCESVLSPQDVKKALKECPHAAAVYITSPDYLGNISDVRGIADVCHEYGKILLVDNAHGAYLKFMNPDRHPLTLGADLVCDSAHKTLPVLTGGAYLHASGAFARRLGEDPAHRMKAAMELFGSTSPSYLIMESLDECERWLLEDASLQFADCAKKVKKLKTQAKKLGFEVPEGEPLKLTVHMEGKAQKLAAGFRKCGIEFEFADQDYVVLMLSPFNTQEDFAAIANAFVSLKGLATVGQKGSPKVLKNLEAKGEHPKQVMSVREAWFAPSEEIPVAKAVGRICAGALASCPPAVPIAVCGELIDRAAVKQMKKNHIKTIEVVR